MSGEPVTTVGAAFCLDCRWDLFIQDSLHVEARAHAVVTGHRTQVAVTQVWAFEPVTAGG